MKGVAGCQLLTLRTHCDDRGGLAFVEGGRDLPFAIARVYYLWGMNSATERGGHAHKCLDQLYIAVSGSFDVHLTDGTTERIVRLATPDQGLYLGHMVWRTLANFSPDAVCLVLASAPYLEADYYRDKAAFLADVEAIP